MNRNREQLRMLHHLARLAGFRNINLWFRSKATDFISVAESWRILQEKLL